MDVPGLRAIVDPLAGEGGHTPLKRGPGAQAIVLEREQRVSNGDQVNRIAYPALKRGQRSDANLITGWAWNRSGPLLIGGS
jgi:hypothetical protein